MSSLFRQLQIPPGVVANATKQMNSSNWAEVNLMRWIEGQMGPIGGQAAFTYQFASRCRAIHGWFGLDQIYRTAYLCESNLYVDQEGVLTEITPVGGMTTPAPEISGGYGTGQYSESTYGTPRPPGTPLPAIVNLPGSYSLDNFGAVLYAMTSVDSRLLFWNPAVGGLAAQQTGAPLGRCFVVTPERFIQIFGQFSDGTTGGGSARRFGWCDQENPGRWNFGDITSQAGYLDVEPASPIVAALATRHGTVFWTGKSAFLSQFVGLPYVYNYIWLADNCTPWSPQSMTTTSAFAFWFSDQGMFTFDGTNIWPVACTVRPWINDDIDLVNVRNQACAVHVAQFNEFWWFFPQDGQQYNTRVIIYNYKEGWWSQGKMSRSAGITASYTTDTIMADGLIAYKHEIGPTSASNMLPWTPNVPLPWAETFDLNITPNGKLITIKQMIPDIQAVDPPNPKAAINAVTNLNYSLFYRNSRSLGSPELQTAPRSVRTDGYVDFRTTGRDIRLKIELAGPSVLPITVGNHLVDAVMRGDR